MSALGWLSLLVALEGFSGTLRVRGESENYRIRRPFVLMRTRITWTWARPHTRLVLQIQDSRRMGEELNTLTDGSADQMDLHQGFLEISGQTRPWRIRLGRMEVRYANERLLGAVGWDNVGRSMDGGVFRYGRENWVDLFGYILRDTDTFQTRLAGIWVHRAPLQVFSILEQRSGDSPGYRLTGGGMGTFALGQTRVQMEVAYQGGRWDTEISAYMVTLSLQRPFAWGQGKIAVDVLSGDDTSTTDVSEVFHTLYPTNHKFYGFMDFFLNIPRDTDGRGLVDAYLTLSRRWDLLTLRMDVHRFLAHQGLEPWGTEIDATLKTRIQQAGIQAGASVMLPETLGRARWGNGPHWWVYAMVTLSLSHTSSHGEP